MGAAHSVTYTRLTVEDLFAESDLGLRLVAGHRGVGQVVLGVHVSELPDPTRWISPGDVLLTTAMSIRESPELQRKLVQQLVAHGMVALGLGVGICVHRAPAALRDEADAVGLPLFEIPFETPFKAVVSFIHDSLVNRNVYLLRRRLSVQAHLLGALLEDRGTDYLISSLAVLLSASVVLFDQAGRVACMTQKGIRMAPEVVERIWHAYEPRLQDPASDILKTHVVDGMQVLFRDVWSNGRLQRVLAIAYPGAEHLPEFTVVIASYVQKLLSLEVMKSREAEQLWRQVRGGLLDDLVLGLGRSDELREQSLHFGFDPAVDHVVLMCAPVGQVRRVGGTRGSESRQAERIDELEDAVGSYFSLHKKPFLSMIRSGAVVATAYAGTRGAVDLRTMLQALRDLLANMLPDLDLALGASGVHRGTESMPRAYAEAQEALTVARREEETDRVRLFADLGPTASFLFGLPIHRLRALTDAGLSVLSGHDEEHGDSLVQTVRMFVDADRDVREASRRLFIHPNTLRYRLRKAEAILGYSLDSTRALADLYLAFRAEAMLLSMDQKAVAVDLASGEGAGLSDVDEGSGLDNLLVGQPAVVLPGELAARQRRMGLS